MSPAAVTRLVLIANAALLGLYSAVMLWLYGPGATVSVVVHDACKKYPVITLLVGIVLGHWFWQLYED